MLFEQTDYNFSLTIMEFNIKQSTNRLIFRYNNATNSYQLQKLQWVKKVFTKSVPINS